MKKILALLALSLGITSINPSEGANAPEAVAQVFPNQPQTIPVPQSVPVPQPSQPDPQPDLLGFDDQIWSRGNRPGDWRSLLRAIDYSLSYLKTGDAKAAYRRLEMPGFSRSRVVRSLARFRQLVISSKTPADLQASVRREFKLYRISRDDRGNALFTAYYTPVHQASRRRTAEYRYPLYQRPSNFARWSKPHPTRAQLQGEDGLSGDRGPLRGYELIWMRDRLEAFLTEVQGSAIIQLTNGSTMSIGYAGATDYPYTSIGKELLKDGRFPPQTKVTIPILEAYFRRNPEVMNLYLPRNERMVFFRSTGSAAPTGSINVPVTPERSIATDKSLMPRGALALIHTKLPYVNASGQLEQRLVSRYVLDQDAGSAIKGRGRVDYYMGTGKQAGDRAGVTGGFGELYYLLLKE
jgi:membrane-bound lytic murein transglycosylase A